MYPVLCTINSKSSWNTLFLHCSPFSNMEATPFPLVQCWVFRPDNAFIEMPNFYLCLYPYLLHATLFTGERMLSLRTCIKLSLFQHFWQWLYVDCMPNDFSTMFSFVIQFVDTIDNVADIMKMLFEDEVVKASYKSVYVGHVLQCYLSLRRYA